MPFSNGAWISVLLMGYDIVPHRVSVVDWDLVWIPIPLVPAILGLMACPIDHFGELEVFEKSFFRRFRNLIAHNVMIFSSKIFRGGVGKPSCFSGRLRRSYWHSSLWVDEFSVKLLSPLGPRKLILLEIFLEPNIVELFFPLVLLETYASDYVPVHELWKGA